MKTSGASPYIARGFKSKSEHALNELRKVLRPTNSKFLGALARGVDYTSRPFRRKYLPLELRALISLLQPADPLRNDSSLPGIELVVPFVEKDLEALPLVLEYARKNIRNPISRVVLITPRDAHGQGPRFVKPDSFPQLDDLLRKNPDIALVHDQDVLGSPIMKEMEIRFGRGDRNAGWVIQQLIKLSAAMQAESEASLILDSDTLLLTPKTWFGANRKQLLQVANEYHSDFMRHVLSFFGVPKKLRMSFVTHHQLMQRDVVREMFPHGSESLLAWWKSSRDPIGRDLGDYEAYGSYLAHHYPERVAYGSFGNLFSPHLTRFLSDLRQSGKSASELIPDYCSVSFHSWAQVDRAERGN